MLASNSKALTGRPIQATVSAWEAPANAATDSVNHNISGRSAIEVTRCMNQ